MRLARIAAPSHSLGIKKSAVALELQRMNEIYSEFAGEGGDMLTSALRHWPQRFLRRLLHPNEQTETKLSGGLTLRCRSCLRRIHWCRKEDYSALRLTPSGSPYGRSNVLRKFVEPACCLSGVRTGGDEYAAPSVAGY